MYLIKFLNILKHSAAYLKPSHTLGSDIRATPPSRLMSAGTLSKAITAHAYSKQNRNEANEKISLLSEK